MTVSDWDEREVCPDGSCVGVIGPDGTCKACGRAATNWGNERQRGLLSERAAEGAEPGLPETLDDTDDDDPIAPSAPAVLGPWSKRTLCPDGSCVGVIGPDGRCKVCHAPAGDAVTADDAELSAAAAELAGVATTGEVSDTSALAETDEDDEEYEDGADEDDADEDDADEDDADEAEDADDEERKLCSDGACIGVIGDDGRCRVCRKEAAA